MFLRNRGICIKDRKSMQRKMMLRNDTRKMTYRKRQPKALSKQTRKEEQSLIWRHRNGTKKRKWQTEKRHSKLASISNYHGSEDKRLIALSQTRR
jgi:hypothetical protein